MLAVTGRRVPEMNRYIKHLCLMAALALALVAPTARAAGEPGDAAEAKAKLAALRARIGALTGRLGGELKQRDAQAARLRDADLTITSARRRLDGLRAAELAAERRRTELRALKARVDQTLDSQRAALAADVRTAYLIGGAERTKLLLMQDDPASAGRMAQYYGYLVRDRSQRIADIDDQLNKLRDLGVQIDATTANLQAMQSDAAHDMDELKKARAERVAALAAVTEQVTSGSQELAELKREEQAEEALVADLADMLQDLPADAQQSFESLRGQLPWPVQGRLTGRFQDVSAHAATGLRRNGVLIETTPGAKVHAPFFGRVIYADWLQGLGLLLIIGHKGNYMTLYGHAEVLYKGVGDWVAPGDVVAAVGDPGGPAPQLYFEIREGRTAKDPALWLKSAH